MSRAYQLASLLAVCRHHEATAERGLAAAKAALVQAQETLEARRKAREAYGVWRVEETARRYDALMGQPQRLADLDAFRIGLTALKTEEARLETQTVEAQEAVNACGKAVDAARDGLNLARKKTAKFTMHKEAWLLEQRREDERREEMELEDFTQPQA